MSTSSPTPAEGGHPFDVEEFARATIQAVEYGDAIASVLEDRVIRLEEITAARWPRRWLLRRRLAREIRASVATWDPEFIPEGDFIGRRYEAVTQMANERPEARRHHPGQTKGWQKHTGWDSAETAPEGDADPGEGFLP